MYKMNSSSTKTTLILNARPSSEEVDFQHLMPLSRNKGVVLGIAIALAVLIGVAINTASTFGISDGLTSDDSLSSLANFIFVTAWLVGWSFGILLCFYILLVAIFGYGVVFIYDDKLEISLGISFLRYGKRIPLSELVSVELVEAAKKSIFASNGGQALLITTRGDNRIHPEGNNFTAQDLEKMEAAIAHCRSVNLEKAAKLGQRLTDSNQAHHYIETEIGNADKRSLWALISANVIPLLGAYFLNWQLAEIVILYWAETLILLFYHSVRNIAVSPIMGFFQSIFNCVHIIMFAAIHFAFIWNIFVLGFWIPTAEKDESLATVFNYLIHLWPALVALFASHGYSLFLHFFQNPNAEKVPLKALSLFVRIIIMHIVVIFGGILALLTNSHWTTLLLLVSLKTIADAKAHSKQHNLLF